VTAGAMPSGVLASRGDYLYQQLDPAQLLLCSRVAVVMSHHERL